MNLTRYDIPAILWFCFILFATLASTATLEVLNIKNLFSYDKLIHMILFGTQAWLIGYGRIRNIRSLSKREIVIIGIFCSIYGTITEILQILVTTTRTFDYYDMIANIAGAVIACVIMTRKWISKKPNHQRLVL
jgi:hypothetical protein